MSVIDSSNLEDDNLSFSLFVESRIIHLPISSSHTMITDYTGNKIEHVWMVGELGLELGLGLVGSQVNKGVPMWGGSGGGKG